MKRTNSNQSESRIYRTKFEPYTYTMCLWRSLCARPKSFSGTIRA
nr:MAG TPA: hypothetical protein [Bacteriophage sp.]